MDIVERLRKHVNDRGGASLENGAWSMMLKGADEIERLREVLQHIRSLATTPVRQIRLRSILEECVWFVNAALKEGE